MTEELVVQSPDGPRTALVDDEDLDLLEPYRWSTAGGKGKGRYAATHVTIYGVAHTHYMHRVVAWAMGLIPSPIGTEGGRWTLSIDHVSGEKLDNRRANLRLLSRPDMEAGALAGV